MIARVSPGVPSPRTNQLLSALSGVERDRLLGASEDVKLKFARVLCEAGDRVRHVYFPTGSFISLMAPLPGMASLEVGMVGTEGMFGLPVVLGARTTPLRAVVQGEGHAWRLRAADFQQALARSPTLRKLLDRYLHYFVGQLARTAACTHFHLVEARLARWLLMTRDRAQSQEFPITHEFLASMLGVRRVGITEAAGALRRRQLIRYQRGDLRILDPRGLEQASCDCYRAEKALYAGVLG